MRQLLIASQNKGKIAEVMSLFKGSDYQIVTLDDTNIDPNFDVEETGETFEANARLKALGFSQATGLMCLSDDSGLVVDALNGRPGVYSKRYGDSDEHRNQKLLSELSEVKDADRSARFEAVICVYNPEDESYVCRNGTVEGFISHQPKGTQGFGYDPIFIPVEGDGRTFGEYGADFKNTISHRARALKKIKAVL